MRIDFLNYNVHTKLSHKTLEYVFNLISETVYSQQLPPERLDNHREAVRQFFELFFDLYRSNNQKDHPKDQELLLKVGQEIEKKISDVEQMNGHIVDMKRYKTQEHSIDFWK